MKFDTHMDYFISSKKYEILIKMKAREFVEEYENLSFLEWNYADEWAYRKLKQSGYLNNIDFDSDWFDLIR